MANFVHLHNHTDYSLLDGIASISKMVAKAKELGMSALAITDHGNMYGTMNFYDACIANNIKPILGCEFYIAPKSRFEQDSNCRYYHIILLAKNLTGYKNLLKLSGKSFNEGFYYKPRIDDELLEKYHEGLICSSACLAGSIPRYIVSGQYEKAKEKALYYNNLFGEGNFYLEVQDHGIAEQKITNEAIYKISAETNIPIVATNDIHYVNKEDWEAQTVALCIGMQRTLDQADRMEFKTHEFYLKSEEEMAEVFHGHLEALENSAKIAEMCNVELEKIGGILPNYPIPTEFKSAEDYVRYLVEKGKNERFSEITKEIEDRIDYELSVIFNLKGKSYAGYFLIVWDFINYARQHNIPVGPGRGSGAGSLVAYCMHITDIDPLKYDLLFERFLNPDRISLPDFDIDFCNEGREQVINYVREKYGHDKVSAIVTFGTLKTKAVIKDVARVLGIAYEESNTISKLIPDEVEIEKEKKVAIKENEKIDVTENNESELISQGYTIKNEVYKDRKKVDKLGINYVVNKTPELKQYITTNEKKETYIKLFKIAETLQNLNRQSSKHACGMVIGKENIDEYVPTAIDTETKTTVTQFTMDKLEDRGLVKMDFLGLKTLTIIKKSIYLIHKINPDFKEEDIDYEDKDTFKLLCDGESECVFQFESDGMKKILQNAQPSSVEDMIALNALYRPGPLDWIPVYIAYKHNREPDFGSDEKKRQNFKKLELLCKKNEALNSILKPTNMIPIYQEQIMKIGQRVAGLSLGQADMMRRAMSKKKGLENYKKGFIIGSVSYGLLTEEEAIFLFDDVIMPFSGYGFNKSHAAAYSVLAFKTAYLKTHYFQEFMAANLTNEIGGDPKKLAFYLDYCKTRGIKILPPDINYSEQDFTVVDGNIFYGLNGMKGLGTAAVENIIESRKENGLFTSFYDFLLKVDFRACSKRVIESLIYSGAMSSIENRTRAELFNNLEYLMNYAAMQKQRSSKNVNSLFGDDDAEVFPDPVYKSYPEWNLTEVLENEKNVLGYYASGHPFDKYKSYFEKATFDSFKNYKNSTEVSAFGKVIDLRVITTKNNAKMALFKIQDYNKTTPVVVFPKDWKNVSDNIIQDNMLYFNAKTGEDNKGFPQLILSSIIVMKKQYDLVNIKLKEMYTKENLYNLKDHIENKSAGQSNFYIYLPTKEGEKILKSNNLKIDTSEDTLNKIRELNYIDSVWTSS